MPLHMRWEDLLFLHWRVPPSRLAARLPPGLQLDLHRGEAWIGAVPFRMRAVRLPGSPRLPGLHDFLELNLRTYVRDRHGRPGVYFFTLDCDRPPVVWAARLGFGLRYRHARMRASPPVVPSAVEAGHAVDILSYRAGGGSRFRYRRAGEWRAAADDPLHRFLVERYRLFAWRPCRRQLWTGVVSHAPYAVAPADAKADCAALFRAQGLSAPRRPADHALVARPVLVLACPPEPVSKLQQ